MMLILCLSSSAHSQDALVVGLSHLCQQDWSSEKRAGNRVGRVESKRGAASTSESVSYCIATIAVTSLLHLKSLTTALLSNSNLEKEMSTHSSILAWRIQDGGAWWTAIYGVARVRYD